jgi:hypothetical protein
MDAIMELYNDNLRRQGLAEAAAADLVDVRPARRTVDQPPMPVQVIKPAVVCDDRVTDLERRIAALENLLRPVLSQKPGKLEQIHLDYLSLAGKTDLSFDQFRCLPKPRRQALLAGVGHE